MLAGFTITNGWLGNTVSGNTANGAGIYCQSTACVVSNCIITGNATTGSGGGIIEGTIFDCVISNNNAYNDGGGVVGGILTNCLIVGNSALGNGGGVYAVSPGFGNVPAVLNNCIISNNAAYVGGGVNNLVLSPGPGNTGYKSCILNNCTLTYNFSTNGGAGAYGAELNDCLISSNQAIGYQTAAIVGGGGVEGGLLNNCILIGNSANAPYSVGGGADGSAIGRNNLTVLSNCVLIANVAPQGGGANDCTLIGCTLLQNSVHWYGSSGSVGGGAALSALVNCLVISNSDNIVSILNHYSGGGGAYSCTLTNCVLADNVATNGGGANVSSLVNCTVIANTATNGGGTLNCAVENSILYYNTGGDYSPGTTQYPLNYCCTALLPTNGLWNITSAPLFVNLVGGNYHLQSTFPSINSGNNAYIRATTDLDGNPRIVGGTVDIGAYEYQTPTSVISYAYLQQYGLPTDGSEDFADLDGSGFSIYQDWAAGLNPTNSASVLAMVIPTVATNDVAGIKVTWQSVSGILYNLQRSTNLSSPFTTIQSNITGQSGTTSYTDATATGNVPYFYRVSVTAP